MKTRTRHLLFFIFLLCLPQAIHAQWEKVTDGRLPAKALRVSTTFNGEDMYIARAIIDGRGFQKIPMTFQNFKA